MGDSSEKSSLNAVQPYWGYFRCDWAILLSFPSTSAKYLDEYFASLLPLSTLAPTLHTLLFIAVASTIAGADGPEDMAKFAKRKAQWLKQFVDLEDGVPSHDTLGRVLGALRIACPSALSLLSQRVVKALVLCHKVMDVVFGEDRNRIRQGHAAENMSFLRQFVTTLLKQDTSKSSLKQKRKDAAWDTDFLETLLFQ